MSLQDAWRAPPAQRFSFAIVMLALAALALWFIVTGVLPYAHVSETAYGRYWPRRFGLVPHIAGGLIALCAGLAQLWLGVTGRTRALHRWLGRCYVAGVATGSLGGWYMALTTTDTLAYGAGLFFMATAWAMTTSLAWLAARRKQIEQHREWAIRSYIVTFAFVTIRLSFNILSAQKVAPDSDLAALTAWGCWAVPLLLAEPLLQYRKLKRR